MLQIAHREKTTKMASKIALLLMLVFSLAGKIAYSWANSFISNDDDDDNDNNNNNTQGLFAYCRYNKNNKTKLTGATTTTTSVYLFRV